MTRLGFSDRTWATLGVGVAGIVIGIIGWGGFNTVMEATNSLEFCISCHEMRDTVYVEYQKTVHYKNPSGVRAICSDCHVPKDWVPKVIRKVQASNELFHKVVGTIGTPEKFEAKRLELARSVWASMKATNSRECRNCHAFESMDFHKQKPTGAKQMQKAMTDGQTCIDCHKGIAHKLPDMSGGYRMMFDDMAKAATTLSPKAGDTVYPLLISPLYLAKPTGADAANDGRLLAGSALKVIARDGDMVQVRIAGWQQQGAERLIYAQQGKRIFVAALTPRSVASVKAGDSMNDPDTGQTWSQVTLEAWVANKNLATDAAKLEAYGAELFSASCNVCHTAPEAGHYLANEWIGVLEGMKQQISLDEEQYRFLQRYLQTHARDTGGKH